MVNILNLNLKAGREAISKIINDVKQELADFEPFQTTIMGLEEFKRICNVIPDGYSIQDYYYEPISKMEPYKVGFKLYINPHLDLVPIEDQGDEGSCTGHAVVSACELMLAAGDSTFPENKLSTRWAYEKAKLHDPWPGTAYEGSTVRAAMTAWKYYGICQEKFWPYVPNNRGAPEDGADENAEHTKLKVYQRAYPNRLGDIRYIVDAIKQYSVVVATAKVHEGWRSPINGVIPFNTSMKYLGGHAIALAGYSDIGFLVRNSWGEDWGHHGYAWLTYADAVINLMDAWIPFDPREFGPF